MTDRYAVIGNPIEHSKSPQIHAAFARQTGQDLEYDRLLGEPGRFAAQVRRFLAGGGRGLNVTVPFKEEAWRLVDERSERATLAEAVNTILPLADGRLRGDNTDGIGLVRDLEANHGIELRALRVLVLGAGGACRGVLGPLLECRPERLVVANRTASKALDLAARWCERGPVSGVGLDGLAGERFDLVINATTTSLSDRVPAIPDDVLTEGSCCYDMMYADRPTAFVRWGLARGAGKAFDGLGMLVEQAAESFYEWRGVRPETAPVIRALRSTL